MMLTAMSKQNLVTKMLKRMDFDSQLNWLKAQPMRMQALLLLGRY